jgi:hypothetical protein
MDGVEKIRNGGGNANKAVHRVKSNGKHPTFNIEHPTPNVSAMPKSQ